MARFQRREAQHGRPVAVIVTSRTAVADRVRYPDGAVALRLEPFRRDQIDEWVARWNRHNTDYFAQAGIRPLAADAMHRQQALSGQPLLLLMLAIYDAEANALQPGEPGDPGHPIDESTLYEQLLTAFAVRETEKAGPLLLPDRTARVESELQRLSLVAFAMMNRGRQWITESDLNVDLAAVVGPQAVTSSNFRAPLSQAEIALGRFFFIQRAQAIQGGIPLVTYEFLHATFGEFLVARLAVQLAAGLLAQRAPLAVTTPTVDDDLLYTVLSFAPLSSRQQLRFVRGCAARMVSDDERPRLGALLAGLVDASRSGSRRQYDGYRPQPSPLALRHGVYSANLLLLSLVFTSPLTAHELFPNSPDPAGTWHRRTLLWRSALTEQGWTDFALALHVRACWRVGVRDLQIEMQGDGPPFPETADLYWHYRYPPEHEQRNNVIWRRPYVHQVIHKMHVGGGTNDSTIRHTIEPLLGRLDQTLTTFMGIDDRPPTSFAHDLLNLWTSSALAATADELDDSYQRCIRVLSHLNIWGPEFQNVAVVILHQLKGDIPRLSEKTVIECLATALSYVQRSRPTTPRVIDLVAECVSAAMQRDFTDSHRNELTRIATACRDATK